MDCIKTIKICKKYIKGNQTIAAVDNITQTFKSGNLYAIVGHSGSGKTTLLQCLGLLDKLTEGEILIENLNTSSMNENELAKIRREKIGFIFQMFYLIPNLTALENVMIPLFLNKSLSMKDIKNKAFNMLKKVGLEDRANHYPDELSGGEQQRVAIARALVNNPSIILADEPTGNLDEENEAIILNLLKKCSTEGKCVIVVSHSNTIYNFSDEILTMKKGKLYKNE